MLFKDLEGKIMNIIYKFCSCKFQVQYTLMNGCFKLKTVCPVYDIGRSPPMEVKNSLKT